MSWLYVALIGAAAVLSGLGIKLVFNWIDGLIKNRTSGPVEKALLQINDYVETVVSDLQENVVKVLKQEGKWNKDAAKKVKNEAVESVYKLIDVGDIMESLNISEDDVRALILKKIEQYVFRNKLFGGGTETKEGDSSTGSSKSGSSKSSSKSSSGKKGSNAKSS